MRIAELGVAVTTYNRKERLARCIEHLLRHTRTPFELIVADDGSTDGTGAWLTERLIPHVGAVNRGIAWNKNRALFWLSEVRPCRTVIVIEDDCYPDADGWERAWIESTDRFGHMNNAGDWLRSYFTGGQGTASDPYRSRAVSGQCVSFSREALRWAGYFDTRFGRYGHEHVEHRLRLLKLGYGGRNTTGENGILEFLMLDGNIRVTTEDSNSSPENLAHNEDVFQRVKDESLWRPAWRSDAEMLAMKAEIEQAYAGVGSGGF